MTLAHLSGEKPQDAEHGQMEKPSEYPCRRSSYESAGGWRDGRLGQAYDLVHAAMVSLGIETRNSTLLASIENFDATGETE